MMKEGCQVDLLMLRVNFWIRSVQDFWAIKS